MAWLESDEFRRLYVTESATAWLDAQIDQSLNGGRREVAKLISADKATDVFNASDPYTDEQNDLREAQGKLAYREMLLIQSSRTRDGGIIESERDANGDTVNKYVSFAEVEARRNALKASAMEILEIYLTPEEASENIFKHASGSVPIEIVW